MQDTYGSSDALGLRDMDKPVVGDDDVLVHTAAVDSGDWRPMARAGRT